MPDTLKRTPPFFALCPCKQHGWIVTTTLLRVECDSPKEALTSLSTLVRQSMVPEADEARIAREIGEAKFDVEDPNHFRTSMEVLGAEEGGDDDSPQHMH